MRGLGERLRRLDDAVAPARAQRSAGRWLYIHGWPVLAIAGLVLLVVAIVEFAMTHVAAGGGWLAGAAVVSLMSVDGRRLLALERQGRQR